MRFRKGYQIGLAAVISVLFLFVTMQGMRAVMEHDDPEGDDRFRLAETPHVDPALGDETPGIAGSGQVEFGVTGHDRDRLLQRERARVRQGAEATDADARGFGRRARAGAARGGEASRRGKRASHPCLFGAGAARGGSRCVSRFLHVNLFSSTTNKIIGHMRGC